ncbi:amidohydrolase [Mycobacterium liflandii 128FXT]|uniref:Amidohydrolase n=1 Tax=Mycobacterium liflandii (strain 128FXT) TaxID=459424 RepID=L7V3A8_MYCL1|nr:MULTISPECIES: carbon-nitrogen hydrolase family protein [Mycobacterium ulcerans group]AGC61015.1 amidohydrolase [Mycobacterium liflandii 128FXT]ULL09511.1 aliphatic nitrilase [Mycobacterium liflandii]
MPNDRLPVVRVAAVQAAPVFLDRDATLDKLESLVTDAATQGAELVVFGESFVAGFPIWGSVLPPVDQHEFHLGLFESSITVPGPHAQRLGSIAARNGVVLSVGVNERASHSLGQVFNSNLIFDQHGNLVNHRRKLVGTWHERMTWSHGDAHGLEPVELDGWFLGALICGENTNTLAKYTLLAQGERLHIATYPPAWPFDQRAGVPEYDLAESIRLRSAAHSFEGKVFTIVAATVLDAQAVDAVARGDERIERQLRSTPTVSMVVGPRGEIVAGPPETAEGIVLTTVDLHEEIVLKRAQDIVGTYNRFDIFDLRVDKRRHPAITTREDPIVLDSAALEAESVQNGEAVAHDGR